MPNTPNPASELFNGVLAIVKQQIESGTKDELIACTPALIAFFKWCAANPSGVGIPTEYGPQLLLLQTSVLAAQVTVKNELIVSASYSMVGLLEKMLSQATAVPVAPVA